MKKYELIKHKNKKIFTVVITADSNDADYVTTITDYTESQFNLLVYELIRLEKFYGGRHELEDFETNYDEICIPYSDHGICHTLSSIDVYCVDEDSTYYNVKLNLDLVVDDTPAEYEYEDESED